MSEAFRLHEFHCSGCSEYANHGGAWTPKAGVTGGEPPSGLRDAGFDSPPPPSFPYYTDIPDHVCTPECYGC